MTDHRVNASDVRRVLLADNKWYDVSLGTFEVTDDGTGIFQPVGTNKRVFVQPGSILAIETLA